MLASLTTIKSRYEFSHMNDTYIEKPIGHSNGTCGSFRSLCHFTTSFHIVSSKAYRDQHINIDLELSCQGLATLLFFLSVVLPET